MAWAASMFTDCTVPWAKDDRTNTTCAAPVTSRSSRYLAAPVRTAGSSSRRTAWPRIEPDSAMCPPLLRSTRHPSRCEPRESAPIAAAGRVGATSGRRLGRSELHSLAQGTVDEEVGAGDAAGPRAGQEHDAGRHLLGRPHAARRVEGELGIEDVGQILLGVRPESAGKVG